MADETETKTLPQLEPKQFALAEYVLQGKPKREAYKLAGYKAVKTEVIDAVANEILRNPLVAEYINIRQEEIQRQIRDNTNATIERTVRELARIGYQNPKGLFNIDGTVKNIDDMTDEQAATIAGFECVETFIGEGENREWTGYLKKVKFWPKTQATDQLNKHLGSYEKDNEQKRPVVLLELANLPKDQLLELAEMQPIAKRNN